MKPLVKPVEELPREQLPHHEDPRCVPVRRLLQTVGSKGYDGFALLRVR